MKTKGHFHITPCLQEHHVQYLHAFARIQHVYWEEDVICGIGDPLREAVGLPVGEGGLYVVGTSDTDWDDICFSHPEKFAYYKDDGTIAASTPGLWCQWRPTMDRCGLAWDGGDTSSGNHVEWLRFIREHFLDRWGYRLSGSVWISDVFQECLIEANIVAAETITFHILQRYVEHESTE